ncbi:MAG: DUF3604 domain-containing protein [Trueperaceae bacterium]|nr:MAG: DUF3604 domain-containing protein [Trueperaceae bacterium]
MHRTYWGDLHSHCAISYGTGSLERALRAAAGHLDFASVTGHASWPDMPTDRARYADVIDYHRDGFDRFAALWPTVQAVTERHHVPGTFVPILSCEWHSIAVGDHNVYLPGATGPIPAGDDLVALARAAPAGSLLVPHHVGYGPGARGIDWDAFDAARSPVVEVVSTHGASDTGSGAVASFHTMGPYHAAGSVEAGLRRGHRFGFVGGSDHHAGYPGHHGSGRTAVLAAELTREAIFDALRERRCYAVTGDKIILALHIEDAPMGSALQRPRARHVRVEARGEDAIEALELVRNGAVVASARSDTNTADVHARGTWKVRLDWGWGEKHLPVEWHGEARVRGGALRRAEPMFRGEEVLDPRDAHHGETGDDPEHALDACRDDAVQWRSRTRGNPHPRVPSTAGVVLEIDGDGHTTLDIRVNDLSVRHTLAELAQGAVAHRLRGWLSEALLVHRAVPETAFTARLDLVDEGERDVDVYRVRVRQSNGERAWSSPIWVERG